MAGVKLGFVGFIPYLCIMMRNQNWVVAQRIDGEKTTWIVGGNGMGGTNWTDSEDKAARHNQARAGYVKRWYENEGMKGMVIYQS